MNKTEKRFCISHNEFFIAGAWMAFAVLMQWLSLFVFNSLLLSFLVYTVLASVLLPLAYLLMIKKISVRKIWEYLNPVPFTQKQLRFSLLLGAAMAITMVLAFLLFGRVFMNENQAVGVVAQWGIKPNLMSLFYFGGLFLNGGTEELFWRGFIHAKLSARGSRFFAISFPALVFGAQHIFVISRLVPNTFTICLFMAAILGSGFVWGIIREKTGSLLTCIVCHMLVAAGYLGIFAAYLFA